jgi:uncharacterized protein YjbI with pentapeptide repeats
MFEAGDLEQLNIPPVESVTPIDSSTQDARKARLIQVLRLRGRSSFNRDLDLARALASNLNLACASDLARAIASISARASTRISASDISQDLDRNLASAIALGLALDLASASALDLDLDLDLDLAIDSDSKAEGDLAQDLVRARISASDIARKVYPDLDQDLTSDLSEADLNGANLRYINLTGADLTGADLTYADVTGTIFGNNPGLTEADKRDLQSREAIFQAPPSSDVPALVLR